MYSTGDLDLKLKITSEKEVSLEFIASEATQIWNELKKRGLVYGDLEGSDKFMTEMSKAHPELSKSYPIVLKYICYMHEYDKTTFLRWLKKIAVKPWLTEKAYFEAQADYVVMLYKATHKNAPKTHLSNLRANVTNMLMQEDSQFKNCVKSAESIVTETEDRLKKQRMADISAFIELAKDTMHLAGTIRTETDLSMTDLPQISTDIEPIDRSDVLSLLE